MGDAKAPNELIKLVFLGSYLGMIGLSVISGILQGIGGDVGEIGSVVATLFAVPCVIGWIASALWWLWDAWASVPTSYREAALLGTSFGPGSPLALFFIPCFNVVWVFLCNIGLAESINRALAAQGSSTRVPTALVICACVVQVVPYCNLLFGPPIWFAVMFVTDQARRELSRVDAARIAQVF